MSRPLRRAQLFVVLWPLAALAPAAPRLALSSCKPDGVEETLRCGTLRVPENRVARTGRTIGLNVVVLPALDEKLKREPLFDLAGGPGLAATAGVDFYTAEGRSYRAHRDVVLVDQRGTGRSHPLQCRPLDGSLQAFLSEMYPIAYVRACREDLESRADLTLYTTSIAMDDLDDVREALGHPRINLIGLSYGTRAALVYARRHPTRVRAAVLMGVCPTWARLPSEHAATAQRALERMFEDCAAEAECRGAYPRLREEWRDVLARLARAPARVAYAWPAGAPPAEVSIARDVFAEKVRLRLYAPASRRSLPLAIHAAAGGDFQPFLRQVLPKNPDPPMAISDGLYLSITCSEDVPFIDLEKAMRESGATDFGSYRVAQQRRACDLWPRASLPETDLSDVVSDAPVLILSGGRDPVTPLSWAERAAKRLPRSRHVVVDQSAHLPDGLEDLTCWDRVVNDFLDRGSADGLDARCLDALKPPPFALPAN